MEQFDLALVFMHIYGCHKPVDGTEFPACKIYKVLFSQSIFSSLLFQLVYIIKETCLLLKKIVSNKINISIKN